MRAGLRCVAISQSVIVVILHGVLVLISGKGPEAVEMDPVAEARGQGVHEQSGGWAFYVHFVCQPIPRREKEKRRLELIAQGK